MNEPGGLPWPTAARQSPQTPLDGDLMARVARGDTQAYGALFDLLSPRVHGLVRRVVRNPALSEEVTQEVMVEIWRTASRYDPSRGSVSAWALTMAHRRAVDRVRSEQAASDRDHVVGSRSAEIDFDQVTDAVVSRLEVEQVRRCLGSLTELQRESITLAYYQGYTYNEVATLLEAKVPTVKARMRDGLIRLRDCLGIAGSDDRE
ncbi:ECF RNA polymerase sigma factor SigK [Kribbella sp. CA-293567]|uniref:ECF RNA polymerase sigma factor SigK n=1 Tax=Kribbella sp. CA-293567 TaxID=3002436 RepID=UPI0022DDCF59|nr:ECF RNA polymerase sigma factor SigK [Kribbella sp. CA-293567]WBQ07939.1 ECF RNA polymerase sigma factor SigK [Kribbella sp. CA-293567]